LFSDPNIILCFPVRTPSSPKAEEEDGKNLARKAFEFADHETHVLTRD